MIGPRRAIQATPCCHMVTASRPPTVRRRRVIPCSPSKETLVTPTAPAYTRMTDGHVSGARLSGKSAYLTYFMRPTGSLTACAASAPPDTSVRRLGGPTPYMYIDRWRQVDSTVHSAKLLTTFLRCRTLSLWSTPFSPRLWPPTS